MNPRIAQIRLFARMKPHADMVEKVRGDEMGDSERTGKKVYDKSDAPRAYTWIPMKADYSAENVPAHDDAGFQPCREPRHSGLSSAANMMVED